VSLDSAELSEAQGEVVSVTTRRIWLFGLLLLGVLCLLALSSYAVHFWLRPRLMLDRCVRIRGAAARFIEKRGRYPETWDEVVQAGCVPSKARTFVNPYTFRGYLTWVGLNGPVAPAEGDFVLMGASGGILSDGTYELVRVRGPCPAGAPKTLNWGLAGILAASRAEADTSE